MSERDIDFDDSGESTGSETAERRPTLTAHHEHPPAESTTAREALAPAATPHHVLDKDETVGLVSVLFHAQQAVLTASRFADDARDANDEELALFLEASLRESSVRAEEAKSLLAARLQKARTGDGTRLR